MVGVGGEFNTHSKPQRIRIYICSEVTEIYSRRSIFAEGLSNLLVLKES